MNSVIYKYQLELEEFQTLNLPCGACVLDVQIQEVQKSRGRAKVITLWAEVNPQDEEVEVEFWILGTGVEWTGKGAVSALLPEYDYLSTVQLEGFVWHVYWGEK